MRPRRRPRRSRWCACWWPATRPSPAPRAPCSRWPTRPATSPPPTCSRNASPCTSRRPGCCARCSRNDGPHAPSGRCPPRGRSVRLGCDPRFPRAWSGLRPANPRNVRRNTMSDALIYDHVRTPRGKGKKDGSLHQATPVWLLRGLLQSLQRRLDLDPALVDDVVLGCVTPVGEQGADIARTAVLDAGWAESVAGVTLSRFCASGLEAVNLAAAKVASGFEDFVVAGGIESMSRWTMGSDGGAWFMDPRIKPGKAFIPQGISADLIATLEGFSRHDLDSYALQSHQRAAAARADGRFRKSIVPVHDIAALPMLAEDETIRANATMEAMARLEPSFAAMGAMGFDATALRKYTTVEKIAHVHHAGNASGIVAGAALMLIGSRDVGERAGLRARARIRSAAVIGSEPTIML